MPRAKRTAVTPARKEPDQESYVGRVAVRIGELRKKSRLSMEEFAEEVSASSGFRVPTSTAYAWENGNSTPNLKMLPCIAESLGVKARNVLPNE